MTNSLGKYHNIWEKSPCWIQNDRPKSHFAHRLSWINEILLEVVPLQEGHDNIRKNFKKSSTWIQKPNFQIVGGRETKFSLKVYGQE